MALLFVTGCAPTEQSLRYTSVSEKFKGIERVDSTEQPLPEDNQARICSACVETAGEISTNVHRYRQSSLRFGLWCLLVAFVVGLALAWTVQALARRRKVGWRWFAAAAAVAYVVAALASAGIYRATVVDDVRTLVIADRLLRQLKDAGWIPGTKDTAWLDFTANCVDRLRRVADGQRIEGAKDSVARYAPLYTELDPLPSDASGSQENQYWSGLQARAADAVKLLSVQDTWQEKDIFLHPAEILGANPNFRDAGKAQLLGEWGYWLFVHRLPGNIPPGTVVILALIPVLANLFLWFMTGVRKRELVRRLRPLPIS